jgi:hypothetical protein
MQEICIRFDVARPAREHQAIDHCARLRTGNGVTEQPRGSARAEWPDVARLGRTCPDLDAHLFFDPDEIRAAYLLTKTRAPAQSRLNEVLRLIARLGGFLARKGDGEPGAETIWKGLTTVRIAAETMRLLRDHSGSDTCV